MINFFNSSTFSIKNHKKINYILLFFALICTYIYFANGFFTNNGSYYYLFDASVPDLILEIHVILGALSIPYLVLLLVNTLANSKMIITATTLLGIFFAYTYGSIAFDVITHMLVGETIYLNFELGWLGVTVLFQLFIVCIVLFIPMMILFIKSLVTGKFDF